MAVIDKTESLPTPEQKRAELQRRFPPRNFDELLGPQPPPGTDGEVDDFLSWLEERRRLSATGIEGS
jgi:hypothetical protein